MTNVYTQTISSKRFDVSEGIAVASQDCFILILLFVGILIQVEKSDLFLRLGPNFLQQSRKMITKDSFRHQLVAPDVILRAPGSRMHDLGSPRPNGCGEQYP